MVREPWPGCGDALGGDDGLHLGETRTHDVPYLRPRNGEADDGGQLGGGLGDLRRIDHEKFSPAFPGSTRPLLKSERDQSGRTMPAEELPSQICHADEGSEAVVIVTLDEATFVGLLPHRETGGLGPPG